MSGYSATRSTRVDSVGSFAATSGDEEAVVKLVPKAPGSDRELLFIDLDKVRNVVPIIDSGEHEDYWVLVMPRAELSLRKHLDTLGSSLPLDEVIQVATDIVDTLVDLDGRVVHRDLKPENVLRLKGHWCLADFGISRYDADLENPFLLRNGEARAHESVAHGFARSQDPEPSPPT